MDPPDEVLLGALIAASIAYLAVGLAPFTFEFSRPLRMHWIFVTPVNGLLNWACFVPVGMLIAKLSFVDRPLVAAAVTCGAASLAVEALQMFIPGRFCCLSDWFLNTAGAITGAWIVDATGS
jgi:glycopeptide antibiotics resistance protein